ncbi:hypothetical protein FS837_006786 [Tulasnella sp. UAMH 9824]|nr:hypothetical protein FS837_006786 [Tulasnella sp. UAMH 9824]
MTCNILFVGYGAVGVVIAYALQKTGKVNVTAVARSNYQTVYDGKLILKSEQYGEIRGLKPSRGEAIVAFSGCKELSSFSPVVRTVAEAADQAYDYVVIATKAIPELYPTSELVAPLLSPDYQYPQPTYVLLQNGLGVEKDLHAALQEKESTRSARIITGAIQIMSNLVGDSVIHSDFSRFFGGFYQDEKGYPSISSGQEKTLHTLVDLLNKGGCEAKADPNVQAAKYRKNLWNASLAMLSCLTRTPCYAFFRDPVTCQSSVHVLLTIVKELIALGQALGYPSEYLQEPAAFVEHYRKHHLEETTAHKASTLLDIEAGRPFELEVILGEVVRLGKKLDVPIPT